MPARNEQIASHFNDKLTPMEYILYNVAVVESDVYNNSKYLMRKKPNEYDHHLFLF